MWGLSYADLGALVKAIGVDHALARSLWATGVHDARVLATKIADPAAMPRRTIDAWIRDCRNYILTDAVSGLAARMPQAEAIASAWIAGASAMNGALIAIGGGYPEARDPPRGQAKRGAVIPSRAMRSTSARLARLVLAGVAAATLLGATPARPAKDVLPFIHDDYSRALAEARSRKLPLFVESWAPW